MTAPARPARFRLGSYLAFAFSVLSILVTAMLIMVSEHTASSQVRSSIGSNLAELANQTTSRLDRSMFERYREVRLMAERLNRTSDLQAIRAELDALQKTYPYYAWIGMADPAGRVLTATGGLLVDANVSSRAWFGNAKQGRNMGDVHEAVLLAKLLGSAGSEPPRFVDIAFEFKSADGRPAGVLGAHLSWLWARDIRNAIFVPLGRSRGVEPLIVSSAGVVLLGPAELQGQTLDLPSLKAGQQPGAGYVTEQWPDGRQYLVGYSRDKGYLGYPGLGWRVLVRQDIKDAYTPVAELQLRLLAGGLAVAGLFLVLGWLAARLITHPLLVLADAARGIEAGESRPMPVFGPYREVEQLRTAFNSLVRNLQQKEADLRELNVSLENRVRERTAELQDAFERVRANEQRIQTIIESAPDPFVGMDFSGRISDWNSRAETLFGWPRQEVLGRRLSQVLLPPRYAGATEAALHLFRTTGQAPFAERHMERVVIDRYGREIAVEMTIGLIDTGQLKLFSAFVRDITERKEIDRMKDEFIGTVSHELRTPLTAIYGSLSLLGSGVAGPLPAQARELVQMSNQSCERLIRLINDVLDVEKIASGQLSYDMKPQDLRPLVERALRDTQPYADGFKVQLRLEDAIDAQVLADGDRILQVLVNLLSNAAKFSPAGASVEVGMSAADGRVRVSVVDQGPGIPPTFRPRVFERFAQADSTDRRQKGGTGLGLNICRSIIDAHQGRIDFDSEPGVRTEFFFELPLA